MTRDTWAVLGKYGRTRALVPLKKMEIKQRFYLLRGEGFDTPSAHPVIHIS